MDNIDLSILNMTETQTIIPASKPVATAEREDFLTLLSSLLSAWAGEEKDNVQNGKIIPQSAENVYATTVGGDTENNSPITPVLKTPISDKPILTDGKSINQTGSARFFSKQVFVSETPVLNRPVLLNSNSDNMADTGRYELNRNNELFQPASGNAVNTERYKQVERYDSDTDILTPELISAILGGQSDLNYVNSAEVQTSANADTGGFIPQRYAFSLTELRDILSVLGGSEPSEDKDKPIQDAKEIPSEKVISGEEIIPAKQTEGYIHYAAARSAVIYLNNENGSAKDNSIKAIPTAESYIARREEIMQAVKEILAWMNSKAETENKNTEKVEVKGNDSPEFLRAVSSPAFSTISDEMMAVMPSKSAASAAAATENVKLLADTKAQPEPTLGEFTVKEQPVNKQTDAAILYTRQTVKKTETVTVTQIDNKDVEKDRPSAILSDKATAKAVPVSEKPVTAPERAPDNSREKQFAQTDPREKQESITKESKDDLKLSFALERNGEGINRAKEVQTKSITFERLPQEKEAVDLSLKVDTVRQQPDTRQTETVLKWESVKDAVNLAKMVQQAGQNGVTKLTVRLHPENLGRLNIQLTEIGGRIDAKIMANSFESRNFLASHGDAIRQQLMDKGIHINNMDFTFHDAFARQDQERHDQQHPAQKTGNGKQSNDKDFSEEKEETDEKRAPERLYA